MCAYGEGQENAKVVWGFPRCGNAVTRSVFTMKSFCCSYSSYTGTKQAGRLQRPSRSSSCNALIWSGTLHVEYFLRRQDSPSRCCGERKDGNRYTTFAPAPLGLEPNITMNHRSIPHGLGLLISA